MVRPTRRQALTGLAALPVTALAGCSGVIDEIPGVGNSEEEQLRKQWKKNDDYPDDEFRNYKMNRQDLGWPTSTGGTVETNFGYHVEALYLGLSEEYHRSFSLEISFEASRHFDVYVIPGEVEFDLGDHPTLSDYDHVPEYSVFETQTYHEIIETTKEETQYTMIITLAGFQPPQSMAEEQEFVQEREELEVEGWTESAVYIPFEEYKENEKVQLLFDHDPDENPLGDE